MHTLVWGSAFCSKTLQHADQKHLKSNQGATTVLQTVNYKMMPAIISFKGIAGNNQKWQENKLN